MLAYMFGLIYKSPGCNIKHACDDLAEQRAKLSLAVTITQIYIVTRWKVKDISTGQICCETVFFCYKILTKVLLAINFFQHKNNWKRAIFSWPLKQNFHLKPQIEKLHLTTLAQLYVKVYTCIQLAGGSIAWNPSVANLAITFRTRQPTDKRAGEK